MNLLNKQKKIIMILFLLLLTLFSEIKAQKDIKFLYKEVSNSLIGQYYNPSKNVTIPNNAYKAEKDIKQNDRAINNTSTLQDCLNQNVVVVLPNYPIIITKDGLKLNSNNVLIFQPNSKLTIENNNLDYYELLKIHNVHNIKILNARLSGDRKGHSSSKGEWGYGISIRNSSDVVIDNFFIDNFWGDGIAIGYGNTKTNKNIVIKNGYLNNNRRNGLSVMNIDGLLVEKLLVSNTNGTNPMFGIDFEPNNASDNLNNITLNNIYTYNNANGGLMLTFSKMKTSTSKTIDFNLNNFKDVGSPNGLMLAGIPKEATGLKGNIKLNNISLDNNISPITGRTIYNKNVFVDIQNVSVVNPQNKNINHKEIKRVFDLKNNYSIKFKN
ncbi:hypothetical protein [Chryseobacterium profundimaris]|uniref:Right handed beta helix domain-containing protein n=1 Tax=Chryseobacterium profundimaris TaxID=1387275 RepID=A0ABY1NQ94_9FLAO|nr:hypothetical protein [Chryseobacterium profundimaris]SMP15481.1 hypothetical protein SAMN06264346_103155 [Chryseobacterium profundimaris]